MQIKIWPELCHLKPSDIEITQEFVIYNSEKFNPIDNGLTLKMQVTVNEWDYIIRVLQI